MSEYSTDSPPGAHLSGTPARPFGIRVSDSGLLLSRGGHAFSGLLTNLVQYFFPFAGSTYLLRIAFLFSMSMLHAAIALISVWLLAGVIPGVTGEMTAGGKIAVLAAACSLGTTMIYLLANLLYLRIAPPGVQTVTTLIVRDVAIVFSLIAATLKRVR